MGTCFSAGCENETEVEFCPKCLVNGGFKTAEDVTPKDFVRLEIENRFMYHAPKPGQPEKYEAIRSKAKELAHMIDELCPNSREKSVAMTELETAVFWANAAIARNE